MRWLVTGGAGFLGINLVRHLLARGDQVTSLDREPFDYPERPRITEVRGDIRRRDDVERAVAGCDVVVHTAAALPLYPPDEIHTIDVDGTRTVLEATAPRRVVHISSTAVYGVPDHHPLVEDDRLSGVGPYGNAKVDAEERCVAARAAGREVPILRPKSFVGPERLGVFEILFDWIREGRRIYTLGKGYNHYQLLGVEDLVDAIVRAGHEPKAARETFNVGATEFGTVRSDLQALIDHAGSSSRLQPIPVKPAELALRGLELMRVSPLAEWHYKTAHKDSFVDVTKAQQLLGWQPRLSNRDALIETYDWYLGNRERVGPAGVTHRVPWNQQALGLLKRLS